MNLDKMLEMLKDKYIEIFMGDQYEEIQLSDHSKQINSCIYGKVVDISGDFFIIDCFYVKNGEVKSGNILFINSLQIRAMSLLDGKGSLSDTFLSINHASKIKNMITK